MKANHFGMRLNPVILHQLIDDQFYDVEDLQRDVASKSAPVRSVSLRY